MAGVSIQLLAAEASKSIDNNRHAMNTLTAANGNPKRIPQPTPVNPDLLLFWLLFFWTMIELNRATIDSQI